MLEAMRVLTGLSIEARGSGNAGGSSGSTSASDAVLGIYAFKTEHPETHRRELDTA